MANLSKNDVFYIARLSNLVLTDDEVEKFTSQLGNIVNFISELSEVDTKDMESAGQVTGLTNIFRDDTVNLFNSLTQEQALSGTENAHNGMFKVKAILNDRTDK